MERKIIGIVGPDLLLSSGGAINHSISVMFELRDNIKFIFLPNPYFIKNFRKNRQTVLRNIQKLTKFQIDVPQIFLKALDGEISARELIKSYSHIDMNGIFDFDYHFPLEKPDFSSLMARKTGLNLGICLQGLSDYSIKPLSFFKRTIKLLITSGSPMVILYSFYQYMSRLLLLSRINGNRDIRIVMTVNNMLDKNIEIKKKSVRVLFPGNGFLNPKSNSDPSMTNSVPVRQENKIIFFARHSYGKGIFDLKPILERISHSADFKLVIIGKFDHKNEESLFIRYFSKYIKDGKIIYKGFIDDEELYSEISTSKLMLYPSHSDAYSIAVMQALSMKTPVVAYNIPGLSIYSRITAVRLVSEFDYGAMASEAISLLRIKDTSALFDEYTESFIAKHTWHNVAEQYLKVFSEL